MNFWLSLGGAYALWTFVCLAVAIPLERPDPRSWHLRLISFGYHIKPKGNCGYFWVLFFAPILVPLGKLFVALFYLVIHVIGLFNDLVIETFTKGRYPVGFFGKAYWKELFRSALDNRERNVAYAPIPGKRLVLPAIALLALGIWLFVGYHTAYKCTGGSCRDDIGRVLVSLWWLTFSVVMVVATLCVAIMRSKDTVGPVVGGVWDFLTQKVCRKLEYTTEESGQ